jgi:hypothetical protein
LLLPYVHHVIRLVDAEADKECIYSPTKGEISEIECRKIMDEGGLNGFLRPFVSAMTIHRLVVIQSVVSGRTSLQFLCWAFLLPVWIELMVWSVVHGS